MLTHLVIRDLAIVDTVELELGPGLTVLTGETGAGKSIIVDALLLASGARATADMLRAGAERAEVCATFDLAQASAALTAVLADQAIEQDGELLVRRVITADGRSRAFLNGQSVTLQVLRDAVGELLDVHGQHEFQSLARPTAQRDLLDEFGRLDAQRSAVAEAYRQWSSAQTRLQLLEGQDRDRDARLQLLRYQEGELAALDLQPGEFEQLGIESQRLGQHGRLLESAAAAAHLLYTGDEATAHEALSQALAKLKPLPAIDARLAPLLPLLEEAAIRISEAGRELSRYADSLELDGARQATVESRLAAAEELARKHRISGAELPALRDSLQQQLSAIEHLDGDIAALRQQQATALQAWRLAAGKLGKARATAAKRFGTDISARLPGLGMQGGRFQADVSTLPDAAPAPQGHDSIEFLVSANPGQPLRPLAKVASGGELSRLSLAVQVACTVGEQRSMVFDEVDTGIGGAVAEIVGRELRALGDRGQVLCVTHLAQVAAQGHQHLRVLKHTDGKQTRTGITALSGDGRVQEVARMLGGVAITQRASEHAREMLESAGGG
jgi:DNA repair protein RecN (Recombination protein N)